ncbi:MAG: beta-N-acetylhexosaminidase [Sphingobacteriales bacterium]|jgi:beta-N-acetylhexosaminidase
MAAFTLSTSRKFRVFFKTAFILVAAAWGSFIVSQGESLPEPPIYSLDQNQREKWADQTLKSMTLDEKIGQLFMVAAYSNRDKAHEESLAKLITENHIGGLIFFQGGPVRQALMQNRLQAQSKIPLMIGMDAEWGLGMRLDSTMNFAKQMTLGAHPNGDLIYEMGAEIARQCKRLGVHVNFAPVVDVNNNPNNPVINYRSFGENKELVAQYGIAYMKGMQDNGILANAKHFPGHGDTDKDSHYSLPLINKSKKELMALEFYPFEQLIKNDLSSMMIAHLNIPALVKGKNTPTTLSPRVVTKILRRKMKFDGLVFTDAMNMKGVSSFYKPGEADVLALLAGNDVILFPMDVPKAFASIKNAMDKRKLTERDIERHVRRILIAKHKAGLDQFKPAEINNLHKDLHTNSSKALQRKLFKPSITLLGDSTNLIPIKSTQTQKIAAISIGDTAINNPFLNTISLYTKVQKFTIAKDAPQRDYDLLLDKVKGFDLVLTAMHSMGNYRTSNYLMSKSSVDFAEYLEKETQQILTVFGNPYSLINFPKNNTILLAYEDNEHTNTLAAQAIFGGIPIVGKIPVSVGARFKAGDGKSIPNTIRLGYDLPEEDNLNSDTLALVDSIMEFAIKDKVTPGAQILIAKNGKVVYHKAFGTPTYDSKKNVELTDVYDIASITKIAATLPAIINLQAQGRLNVNEPLENYYAPARNTNKSKLIIREMLAHQSGLKGWIRFYLNAFEAENDTTKFFSEEMSGEFPFKITNDLYLRQDYVDTMWNHILTSEVDSPGVYKYSDLPYYFMKEIIENITHRPFDLFVENEIYKPLGLQHLTFKPTDKLPLERIIPTEKDSIFRNELVHGYVHDPGAAMLGGIGGHAGLFSNANDLGILMQMYLNEGTYGGKQILDKNTIKDFTRVAYPPENRRGTGFDKPQMDLGLDGPTALSASPSTFGHSGFTGTCAWVDPENDLVYIFLSNRVYPTSKNSKLAKENYRTRIMQVIYNAMNTAA